MTRYYSSLRQGHLPALLLMPVFLMLFAFSQPVQAQWYFEPVPCQMYQTVSQGQLDARGGTLIFSSWSSGVYTSRDQGTTWSYAGLRGMGRFDFAALDDSTFFATVQGSGKYQERTICVTTNAGAQWNTIGFLDNISYTTVGVYGDEVLLYGRFGSSNRSFVLRWQKGRLYMDTLVDQREPLIGIVKIASGAYAQLRYNVNISQYEILISDPDGLNWVRTFQWERFTKIWLFTVDNTGNLIASVSQPDSSDLVYQRSLDGGATWHPLAYTPRKGPFLQDPSDGSMYIVTVDDIIVRLDTASKQTTESRLNVAVQIYETAWKDRIRNLAITEDGSWHLLSESDEYYVSDDKFAGFMKKGQITAGADAYPAFYLSPTDPNTVAILSSVDTGRGRYGISHDLGETITTPIPYRWPSPLSYAYDPDGKFYTLVHQSSTLMKILQLDTATMKWNEFSKGLYRDAFRIYFDPHFGGIYASGYGSQYEYGNLLLHSPDNGTSWDSVYYDKQAPIWSIRTFQDGKVYSVWHNYMYAATIGTWDWDLVIPMWHNNVLGIDTDANGHLYALGKDTLFRYCLDTDTWEGFYTPTGDTTSFLTLYSTFDNAYFDVNQKGDIFLYDRLSREIHFYNSDSAKWCIYPIDLTAWGIKQFVLTEDKVIFLSTSYGAMRGHLVPPTPAEPETPDPPDPPPTLPSSFLVHQNYPNPFNPGTQIEYELPAISTVTIQVTDALGRTVLTADEGSQSAGVHSWHADLTGRPSGLYFYTVRAGDAVQTKKMMLVK